MFAQSVRFEALIYIRIRFFVGPRMFARRLKCSENDRANHGHGCVYLWAYAEWVDIYNFYYTFRYASLDGVPISAILRQTIYSQSKRRITEGLEEQIRSMYPCFWRFEVLSTARLSFHEGEMRGKGRSDMSVLPAGISQ